MYILIFEDGSVVKTTEISEDTFNSADEGYCDILNAENCTQYHNGEWHELETV